MSPKYPLPGDTQKVLRHFPPGRCRNPGLLFARYAPDWRADDKQKKKGLEAVRNARPDDNLLDAFHLRWHTVATSQQAEFFKATTDWRLIVGLGQKGPLEVGFTFHRLYGVPVIPGSALKGIARAYASLAEELGEDDEDFAEIFGRAPKPGEDQDVAQAGRAIFFDAVPWDTPALELDVMNPHYQDYYQQGKSPANWQSPIPIYFLTVTSGISFAFAVGWRGVLEEAGQQLRELAVEWLQAGLQGLGAGAKTSAGYGYFTDLQSLPAPSSPKDAPTTTQAEPPTASGQPTWRTGTVKWYRPDQGRGVLADDESGEEFPFTRDAIEDKGWSPGKKHRVRYAVVEREDRRVVVKMQWLR